MKGILRFIAFVTFCSSGTASLAVPAPPLYDGTESRQAEPIADSEDIVIFPGPIISADVTQSGETEKVSFVCGNSRSLSTSVYIVLQDMASVRSLAEEFREDHGGKYPTFEELKAHMTSLPPEFRAFNVFNPVYAMKSPDDSCVTTGSPSDVISWAVGVWLCPSGDWIKVRAADLEGNYVVGSTDNFAEARKKAQK